MGSYNNSFDVVSVKSARKNHRCTWCAELIEKGTAYDRYASLFDGDFGTVKLHPECLKAMNRDVGIGVEEELYPGIAARGMTNEETELANRNREKREQIYGSI